MNATLAESFGLDRPRGALVSRSSRGSPGEKAGLQVGDIILKYDGKAIERSADLPVLVADVPPGQERAGRGVAQGRGEDAHRRDRPRARPRR